MITLIEAVLSTSENLRSKGQGHKMKVGKNAIQEPFAPIGFWGTVCDLVVFSQPAVGDITSILWHKILSSSRLKLLANANATIEWAWFSGMCMLTSPLQVALLDWLLLFSSRDTTAAQDFLVTMQQEGPKMGIQVRPPQRGGLALPNDRAETYLSFIRQNKTNQVLPRLL